MDDTDHEQVTIKEATQYAKSIKASFHQTSAMDGTGIQQLFTSLAEKLHLQTLSNNVEQTQ